MNKNRKYYLIALIIATNLSYCLQSQENLLKETPAVLEETPKWGPNRANYFQIGFGYGNFLPSSGAEETRLLATNLTDFRLQYKRKLTPFLAMVTEAAYQQANYRLNEENNSPLYQLGYEKEIIKTDGISGAWLIRINPDVKRGNHIGTYFEAGLYGTFLFMHRHVSITREADHFSSRQKTIRRNLSFIDPFQYGLLFRAGWNGWALFYQYRFSTLIDDSEGDFLLPGQVIGVSLSLSN